MAIVVGDRVRPKLTSTGGLGVLSRLNPQPPVIGVVTRADTGNIFATFDEPRTTFTVNPSNLVPNGVRDDALDQITAPNAVLRDSIIDKVVVGLKSDLTTEYSSEYTGTVVDFFNVNGVATCLILTFSGLYYELPFTRVKILPNR